MRRCTCGAGFLDPRPADHEVGRLYATYYTHEPPSPNVAPTGIGMLLRRLRDGYANAQLGHDRESGLRAGALLGRGIPPVGALMERPLRSLPPGRVLDVGCGSGLFVGEANAAGFDARGIDLDEQAVAVARAAGLPVDTARLEEVAEQEPGSYDAVTMSHVIEHVTDPVAFLGAARTVLRAGGLIWIATPNLGGVGHRRFGREWRGLEPPRHMVVFDRPSIELALETAGFADVRWLRPTPVHHHIHAISANGAAGRVPTDLVGKRKSDVRRGARYDALAQVRRHGNDELLLLARAV